jgi:hypothetical protein
MNVSYEGENEKLKMNLCIIVLNFHLFFDYILEKDVSSKKIMKLKLLITITSISEGDGLP